MAKMNDLSCIFSYDVVYQRKSHHRQPDFPEMDFNSTLCYWGGFHLTELDLVMIC